MLPADLELFRVKESIFGISTSREMEIFMTISIYLLVHVMRKASCFEAFVDRSFGWIKLSISGILFLAWLERREMPVAKLYVSWTWLGFYIVAWVFIFFILLPNGNREYPEDIEPYLTTLPSSFFQSHVHKTFSKEGDKKKWLVLFYTEWEGMNVNYCTSMLADIAFEQEYKAKKEEREPSFYFGRMDLERNVDVAKDLNINLSAMATKQIPSIVLFENGKEKKRMPSISETGEVSSCCFDVRSIRETFEI